MAGKDDAHDGGCRDENAFIARQFEAHRAHLQAVAYRILGSRSEAEDAVQESFLRLMRAEADEVANLRAWLTTVVGRVCLDALRSRKSHRHEPLELEAEAVATEEGVDHDAVMADAVGVGMLIVLETLTPPERVAFVLHDLFNLPFEAIAPIVRRSIAAARQLASRARRRVQGAGTRVEADRERQRELVSAFLAASRRGDFSALLALLDPEVVLHADATAVAMSQARAGAGTPMLTREIRGREAVAETFKGRAQAAQPALIEGETGLVFAPGGVPRVVFDFVVEQDRIIEINLIADPAHLAVLSVRMGA